MRHPTIVLVLASLLLAAAPAFTLADETEAAPVRRSTGEVGPVIRAIDRQVASIGGRLGVNAFRIDGDIQLQVTALTNGEETIAAFRRALETDATVLGYLALDTVKSTLGTSGKTHAVIRLSAADGSKYVPAVSRFPTFLDAYQRIEDLACEAKLTVNRDLWKRSIETLPDGTRLWSNTIEIIAWGAAERDFVDLVTKDPDLHAVGAVERDVRSSAPDAITEIPSIKIQHRLPAPR